MTSESSSVSAFVGKKQAEDEIIAEDPTAKDFRWRQILTGFLDSGVFFFMLQYNETEVNKENSFYYVRVDSRGEIKLYDDGISVIEGLLAILEKRRSLLQRLGDFTFFDFIAALIALVVTCTFVYLVIKSPE